MLEKNKSEETVKKIIKFFLLWISSFWLNLLITYFGKEILKFNTNYSYFITISFLTIYQFIVSLKIIFKTDFSFKILFKYLFILFSFSITNYYLVIFFKNYFGEKYLYVIIVFIITILSIIKFIFYNNFVFNKAKKW